MCLIGKKSGLVSTYACNVVGCRRWREWTEWSEKLTTRTDKNKQHNSRTVTPTYRTQRTGLTTSSNYFLFKRISNCYYQCYFEILNQRHQTQKASTKSICPILTDFMFQKSFCNSRGRRLLSLFFTKWKFYQRLKYCRQQLHYFVKMLNSGFCKQMSQLIAFCQKAVESY